MDQLSRTRTLILFLKQFNYILQFNFITAESQTCLSVQSVKIKVGEFKLPSPQKVKLYQI